MTLRHCRSSLLARVLCGLGAIPLAAGLTVWAADAHAQTFTMKFATQTLNDLQHEYIKVYKTEIEAATQGRIKVGIYPASQLGGAQRQTEGLRLGTIEAAIGPAELFVGADPRFQGLAMGGLFTGMDQARQAVQTDGVRQAVSDVAAQRGLVLIGTNLYDLQSFALKAPVTTLEGFKGKRIRVLASEGEQSMVRALGGSSVPMSLPEVLPALQQGTIDGVNSGQGVFVAFKYYDAAKEMLQTHLWALVSISLVSKTWYDKLPPDLQKAVRDTGLKVEKEMNKYQAARLVQDTNAWTSHGGKITHLSAAEQAEAVKRSADAIQPILDKNPGLKEFYGKVKAASATVK
jgi:TRAP-type C4-dicarboxylate transport system substrate-binding protein